MKSFFDEYDRIENEIMTILTNHGIRMYVNSCGCCDGSWVRFDYNGKTITESENKEIYVNEHIKENNPDMPANTMCLGFNMFDGDKNAN